MSRIDLMEGAIEDNSLWIQGEATDHIWGMIEPSKNAGEGDKIGLRFDSGDSGTLLLTRRQAHEVIATLNELLSQI